MYPDKTNSLLRVFVLVTFLLMIVVNALANALPINGLNTGQVSDAYPNLFAPAALTFTIWGLIYLLLALYTLYQLGLFGGKAAGVDQGLLNRVGLIFAVSSLVNTAWIFSWHYQLIPLSMVLMVVLLVCLIAINRMLKPGRLTGRERFFVQLPFRVYFGWITVATIANATVLLVSLGWNGFGLSQVLWTVLILLVGTFIGVLTMCRLRSMAYGLVFIWAYLGILLKHLSADGFGGQYIPVIVTAVICIVIFIIAGFFVIKRRYVK